MATNVQIRDLQLTAEDHNRHSETEKNNVRVGFQQVPQVGTVEIVENPSTGEQKYLIANTFNSTNEFEDQLKFGRRRILAISPYLNRYFDFTSSNDRKVPPFKPWVRHFSEIPKKLLSQLIDAKDEAVRSSVFLTQLLYQIVDAGAALQDVGLAHGNISGSFIAFREPSNFKLIDNFRSLGSLQQASEEILNKTFVYTSPELFQKVMSKERIDRLNVGKHDVFCFGLLLLHLATGCKASDIFNSDGTINISNFYQSIGLFERTYRDMDNRLLAYTVTEKMLQFDTSSRSDFKSIKKSLPPLAEVNRFLQNEYHLSQDMSCHDCRL